MYLWEAVLGAVEEGISVKDLRFLHSERGSAYMEMALSYLNQESSLGERELEVNTYCRFYNIFKDLFGPDLTEYKKLLKRDILEGVYGRLARNVWNNMKREEQEMLLGGMLRSFRTGSSLLIFMDMVRGFVADSIIYRSRVCTDEIVIYTSFKKTIILEQKLKLLQDLFLDIRYHTEVFYEVHFGIIGIECTMKTEETAIY